MPAHGVDAASSSSSPRRNWSAILDAVGPNVIGSVILNRREHHSYELLKSNVVRRVNARRRNEN